MLALRLQTLNEDHSQFIALEEEVAGGGVFLSENLSLKTSGLSSGSEVLVSQPDLLLAVALDSGQLSTTIPVGRFHPPENIDVQGGVQQLNVSWDPVLSASSYRVYYSTESPVLSPGSSMLEVTTTSTEIGGFSDGTFYELLITALEGSSESDFSDGTGAFTLASIPSLPILTGGRGEVQLTWDVVQSASSYNLLISTDPSFSLSSTQNLENLLPPQRIENLLDGTQYYFALNSFNPSGNSSYSSPATTITIPSPPLNISLVGELEQVQLKWETVLGASSYSIFSSTAPLLPASQTLQIQSTAPEQIISNLPPGSLITFALASLNSSGESSPSNPIQTWTLPTSPKAPDLSGGMGIISVSWDAVQGAQYYRVYSSTGPGLPLSATDTTDTSGSSLNLEGLLAGTEYTVALEALNPSGHSELSNHVTTATIPSRPSGLSAQGAARSISVTWNLVSGASTYNLYLATGPSLSLTQTLKFSGVNTPFQFDDLRDATLYYTSLSSMNASGESSQTNLVSVLTLPSVPSELSATPEVEALSLSWPPIPGASSYHLYYSTQPQVPLSSSVFLQLSSSPVRLEELGGAETFYLSLSSLNSTGESSRSVEISATTLLAAPLGLSVESRFGSVSLSWNPVPGAEGYEIHYFDSSSSEIIQTFTSFSSTLLLTGLADGAEFNFNVRALSGTLLSSPSLSIRTITPLAVPDGLMITGTSEPGLSWNPVSGASSYAVFVSTDPIQDSEVQSTYITSELSLEFQTLQKGILHYFRLQSTNPLISSTLSAPLTHLLPPDVPAGFSGISTGESIELSWNHTIGAMSYEIFYSEREAISTTTAQKLTSLSFPLSLDGFSSGTTYYFLLRAINSGGNGELTPILPVSIPYFLRGDFNLDDRLDSQDLDILRAAWEGTSSVPDIASVSSPDTVPVLNSEPSKDGVWDLLDLIVFSMNWNWALANPDPKLWPSRQP
jgi:fibronectin type 3 domain-containing protein